MGIGTDIGLGLGAGIAGGVAARVGQKALLAQTDELARVAAVAPVKGVFTNSTTGLPVIVGGKPVSIKAAKINLGKAGLIVDDYEVVRIANLTDPYGRPVFGRMGVDGAGNLIRGPGSKPLIEVTDLGLESMEQATFTIFHEVHHVRSALGSGVVSMEEHANAFAARMLERFRAAQRAGRY